MATVTIGCRLPNGLVLDLADHTVPPVVLAGQKQGQARSKIITLDSSDYGVTQVDASFWEKFKERVGENFAPLKSGAIFEAKSEKDVKAIVKEKKGDKTGHEPLPQEEAGIKKAA